MPNASWDAATEVDELTNHPTEPTGQILRGEMSNGSMNYTHPVGFICEFINDQLLICRLPSSHLSTCVNERPDVFGNVLDLPTLSVKRNGTESDILKDIYDVSLGSASDTNP